MASISIPSIPIPPTSTTQIPKIAVVMGKTAVIVLLRSLMLLAIIFIITISKNSFASAVEKLMKHASPDGTMSNVNKAAVVQDQQGGYMTGGSVILRGPKPETLQPLVVQTPKFAYDACTGSADFRFGGVSYIKTTEFTKFFKNMATATGAYAVKMFIKSACPQCENIMSDLEAIARDINGLMLDQCASAEALAGGMFNAINASKKQKCLMKSNIIKASDDMYKASEDCKDNPDRHGDVGDKDELKSLLGDNFNLVWKALGKGEGGKKDFKELMMSISGTIIGKKDEGSFQFSNKPSLVMSNDLLEQYIGVSKKAGTDKVKLYQCGGDLECLNPTETEVPLAENDTIYGNVSRILQGLVPKIKENKEEKLTDEEQAVIAFSSVPIIHLIEMELSTKPEAADSIVRMQEFIEVVCYDIVTNFLSQMVTKCMAAVQALEYAQIDNTVIKDFTQQATEVRRFISESKFAAFKRLQIITQVKERLTQQQRVFKAGFGRFLEYNTQM